MSLTRAIDTPVRSQWETSSGSFDASQSNNCGPTCMTFIADFFRDARYGIEATRRLVVACCAPTDITAQREMLNRRGVPAQIYNVASLAALKSIIGSGRRPVGLRIYMARVPYSYRGYSFAGWHEIVAVANGSGGIWMMDPNLRTGALRFYPDWLVNSAFVQNKPAYAVIPIAAKVVAAPTPAPSSGGFPVRFKSINKWYQVGPGVNVRTGPGTNYGIAYTTKAALGTANAKRFLMGEVPGQLYNGSTRWFVWWSPKTSTSDGYDGRLLYCHSSLMRLV